MYVERLACSQINPRTSKKYCNTNNLQLATSSLVSKHLIKIASSLFCFERKCLYISIFLSVSIQHIHTHTPPRIGWKTILPLVCWVVKDSVDLSVVTFVFVDCLGWYQARRRECTVVENCEWIIFNLIDQRSPNTIYTSVLDFCKKKKKKGLFLSCINQLDDLCTTYDGIANTMTLQHPTQKPMGILFRPMLSLGQQSTFSKESGYT